jgi:hypothetical protein
MSIFFEVDVVVEAKLLVEMNDGETAEMAQKVAVEDSNFVGSITAKSAKLVSGVELMKARERCSDTIDL